MDPLQTSNLSFCLLLNRISNAWYLHSEELDHTLNRVPPVLLLSGKIMADQVKDASSPGLSSRMYESLWPSNEITLVLPPWTAGTKGVLRVVILAEGFLRLIA